MPTKHQAGSANRLESPVNTLSNQTPISPITSHHLPSRTIDAAAASRLRYR